MKQAIPASKLPMFILLLFATFGSLSAQDCYQNFMQKGKTAFEAFQFEKAIKNFEAAKVCSDRPDSSEAEEWIAKAQNGYIDRLQLIASKYLTAEAESAFDDKEYRIAFRLCQEALKYKKDNEDALALQDGMLPYLADYQYELKIDPRFYHPNQIVLSDNQLTFFEENIDGKMLVKLIDLEEKEEKRSFEISGNIFDYQFSPDGNWLAVVFYNAREKRLDLSPF